MEIIDLYVVIAAGVFLLLSSFVFFCLVGDGDFRGAGVFLGV